MGVGKSLETETLFEGEVIQLQLYGASVSTGATMMPSGVV